MSVLCHEVRSCDVEMGGKSYAVTSKNIERMLINLLVEARHKKEQLATMEWHPISRCFVCYWKSDFDNMDAPTKMTPNFKKVWKTTKSAYKKNGSGPCRKIDRPFRNTSMMYYGLIIPYKEDTQMAEFFISDPLTIMGFGYLINNARVVWFSSKKCRNQYVKYMNS